MTVQTPGEAVRAMVDAFNSGDLDAFMASYEPGATLVPQPGQVASGPAAIREAMGAFLSLKRKRRHGSRQAPRGGTALPSFHGASVEGGSDRRVGIPRERAR
jgi:hypothetical protein